MPASRLSRSALLCAIAILASPSCSNPESETPVALTPGMYAVQLGSLGKADQQICFSGSDADSVDRLIRKNYAFLESGCSHKADQRVGNRVSGAISCEIDPTAGFRTTYTGTLTADSITVDAEIRNYAPALGSTDKREEVTTESRLTAKRIGDCS